MIFSLFIALHTDFQQGLDYHQKEFWLVITFSVQAPKI